jgi:hypothetical protein
MGHTQSGLRGPRRPATGGDEHAATDGQQPGAQCQRQGDAVGQGAFRRGAEAVAATAIGSWKYVPMLPSYSRVVGADRGAGRDSEVDGHRGLSSRRR